MLKLAVLVSGGGTNLQAIIDAISAGKITNACISVVISNNANAYALERARAHGIEALCISPKDFESREAFNQAFLDKFLQCRSCCAGGIPCSTAGDDDQRIYEPYRKYPSIPDPIFLWKRILWSEST